MVAVSRARAQPAFWVGGTVRDALLGRRPWRSELDIAVTGAPAGFAEALATEVGESAKVIGHFRFGTATVSSASQVAIDVAMTRREVYDRPGTLPRVVAASLADDLARRDFSVNAIAVPVLEPRARIDPFDGSSDLASHRLRILHDGSFVDDPTRLLRGVRLEERLGLRMDAATESAGRRAVRHGALWTVGADRLRVELARAFTEPKIGPIVERWLDLGVWAEVFESPRPSPERLAAWDQHLGRGADSRRRTGAAWSVLLAESSGIEADRALTRLGLSARERALRARSLEILRAWESGVEGDDADRLAAVWSELQPVDREVIEASPLAQTRERAALADARSAVRLEVRGEDLLRSGVPSGPAVGRALRATLRARRRRTISAGEELTYALARARSEAEGEG